MAIPKGFKYPKRLECCECGKKFCFSKKAMRHSINKHDDKAKFRWIDHALGQDKPKKYQDDQV